jgi:hypothetical protein
MPFKLVWVVLSVTIIAAAGCTTTAVGDTCSAACELPATCETVCTCGNASCPTYVCVMPNEAGIFVVDGGIAPSCSQL